MASTKKTVSETESQETVSLALTGKQKRTLRALGHHLNVVVQVGADGVTPGLIGAVKQALADHELVKVKIAADREARDEAIEAIATGTKAHVAQVLGRTALFFKARRKDSKIKL
jgi:RNA-binding protein